MSLTDFKAKMNKSKINEYKINNNNKTNTKHEFNVKYERYKQDISKDTLQHVDCLAFKKLQISQVL
jgi:site-specific DNA-adenine methylase